MRGRTAVSAARSGQVSATPHPSGFACHLLQQGEKASQAQLPTFESDMLRAAG